MDSRFEISVLRLARRMGRRAFTFLEVLFAVIVLGIGFIMVAAMFPAGLKQTQAAVEDAAAGSVWVGASRKFTELAHDRIIPPAAPTTQYVLDQKLKPSGTTANNSRIFSFNDFRQADVASRQVAWEKMRATIIVDSDPRYACVPMYRREVSSDLALFPQGEANAQLFLVVVRSRNKAQYDPSDLDGPLHGMPLQPPGPPLMSRLDPVLFKATFYPPDPQHPDGPYITFTDIYDRDGKVAGKTSPLSASDENVPLGAGAFVVFSEPNQAKDQFRVGHIYRLGARTVADDATTYFIAPDAAGATDIYDVNFKTPSNFAGKVFVVGRAFNPAVNAFDGAVQDIAIVPVPLKLR